MAKRPVFIASSDTLGVVTQMLEFDWYPGFALTQKQRSIASLHTAAEQAGIGTPLEVSSKSDRLEGRRLSAFALMLKMAHGPVPVELAFQASKVFEGGGPYLDLLVAEPGEAKRDERLRSSGKLLSFQFQGELWPLQPRTAFYDWLYTRALAENPERAEVILPFEAFTDIEFNPKKSINCQARSCALYKSMSLLGIRRGDIDERDVFIEALTGESGVQGTLI